MVAAECSPSGSIQSRSYSRQLVSAAHMQQLIPLQLIVFSGLHTAHRAFVPAAALCCW